MMRTITPKEQRQRVYLSRKLYMSRTRRNFSAKFKSDLVLEVLKGGKELNVIATENGIQPILLRKEYTDNLKF